MNNGVLVIIPAYNESSNIMPLIARVKQLLPPNEAFVLVVDDGSSDRTAALSLIAGAKVISHCINRGYGHALRTGYQYAVSKGYDYAIQIDADGQHDPRHIPELLAAVAYGSDVVVGSRFANGPTYQIPFFRRAGMLLFRVLARVAGLNVTDTTSGYRAYSRRAFIKCLELPWAYPDANLLIALHRAGMTITEIPVTMYANKEGKSMHSGIVAPIRYVFETIRSIARVA